MLPLTFIRENVSLHQFNTFQIDSIARYFIDIDHRDQLYELINSGFLQKHPALILGGGSNLLFTSNVNGAVVHIVNKGIEILERDENIVKVKVAAGENWHEFVKFCVKNGFGGLENLSLIPGNVGSSPIQNIGAYGVEVKDCLLSLETIDLQTDELKTLKQDECRFGYRDSIFKHDLKDKVLIWSVTFELNLDPIIHVEYGAIQNELDVLGITNPGIADVSKAICNIRESKLPDPAKIGNAGSFFKNPTIALQLAEKLKEHFPGIVAFPQEDSKVKLAAGWLIEHCGWKGYRQGNVGVHEKQALILVNYGNATGSEILTLAHRIQNSVYERFDVQLEMEVNII